MTPGAAILGRLEAAGLHLRAEGGKLIARPKEAVTDDLRGLIRRHKAELLAVLSLPANDAMSEAHTETRRQEVLLDLDARPSTAAQEDFELFTFAPPGDPANDAEAMAERAAILVVENGMDDATALQEARWQADRERAWRAFLRNAERILEAPAPEREDLLGTYQIEAARRYGERTGTDMAKSLESWVRARGVH